jgi:hypothetical protein
MRNTNLIPILAIGLVIAGCTSQSIRVAVESVDQRAQVAADALETVARISQSEGLPPAVIAPIQDAYKAVGGIRPWTTLMRADVGRTEAAPQIMTNAEVEEQAIYKSRIDMKNALKEAIPLPLSPGGGSGLPWADVGTKGVLGLVTTVLGVLLKKQIGKTRVAEDAAKEGMEVIGSSSDPDLKKRAANKPNLRRKYVEQKNSNYELEIRQLENT